MRFSKLAPALFLLLIAPMARAQLTNGSFESYGVPAGGLSYFTDTNFAGWRTTATDHQIEVWGNGFNGVPSYDGTDFAELNAFQVSTLYQDISGIAAGNLVDFHFAHRGRLGVDTLRLTITDAGADNIIGTADDTTLFTNQYADGNTAWGFYTDPAPLVALGHNVRFAYASISAAGGDPTFGNFLDAANFGVGVNAVPEPGSVALLLGIGTVGAAFLRRRKQSHNAA